jgi:mRNA-degrading endonuclease YafQ of YafQ-DinJ toxin-antitoxin module
MKADFSDTFINSLKKHSSIKKEIQKKVDMIIKNPLMLGEPLKGNFRGFYSTPVKKNFLIIFLYCLLCRKKGDDAVVLCLDCENCADETIRFVALGPHDEAYEKNRFV